MLDICQIVVCSKFAFSLNKTAMFQSFLLAADVYLGAFHGCAVSFDICVTQGVSLPLPEVAPSPVDGPLNVYVVAGPYCTVDGLSYQPLEDFVQQILDNPPDVCVMVRAILFSLSRLKKNNSRICFGVFFFVKAV